MVFYHQVALVSDWRQMDGGHVVRADLLLDLVYQGLQIFYGIHGCVFRVIIARPNGVDGDILPQADGVPIFHFQRPDQFGRLAAGGKIDAAGHSGFRRIALGRRFRTDHRAGAIVRLYELGGDVFLFFAGTVGLHWRRCPPCGHTGERGEPVVHVQFCLLLDLWNRLGRVLHFAEENLICAVFVGIEHLALALQGLGTEVQKEQQAGQSCRQQEKTCPQHPAGKGLGRHQLPTLVDAVGAVGAKRGILMESGTTMWTIFAQDKVPPYGLVFKGPASAAAPIDSGAGD